jgi:hypothetical protein
MSIDLVPIAYKNDAGVDVTDMAHLKRAPYRKRIAMFAAAKGELKTFEWEHIPEIRKAEFIVAMIAATVRTQDGFAAVKPEDVDDWADAKRDAYFGACMKANTPNVTAPVEDVAKNSSSTPNVTT